jgi:hypothetical protein
MMVVEGEMFLSNSELYLAELRSEGHASVTRNLVVNFKFSLTKNNMN